MSERVRDFDEVELGLAPGAALGEAGRCLGCGCGKASACRLREYATEYGADPLRFLGSRRRFARDVSHPEIVYEPGNCILCGACVQAAAADGRGLGLAIVGRGFEVAVAVPLRGTLLEGLPGAARRAADVCPTGAIALRSTGCALAAPGANAGSRGSGGRPAAGAGFAAGIDELKLNQLADALEAEDTSR